MDLLLAAAALTALVVAVVVQLNRTDRRRRTAPADPRTAHRLDRDLERVRADVLAHPADLAQRPLRGAVDVGRRAEWARHA